MSTAPQPESAAPSRISAPHLEAVKPASPESRRLPTIWEPLLSDGVRPLLLAGDLLACLMAIPAARGYLISELSFAVLLITLFNHAGLYRSRLALGILDDLPRIVLRWLVAVALMLLGWQLLDVTPSLANLVAVLGSVLIIRALLYSAVLYLRRTGLVSHATLVVGADRAGRELAGQLEDRRECGLRPVGFLDNRPRDAEGLRLPVLGGPADLYDVLEDVQPTALVVTEGSARDEELVDLVRACHGHRCEVFVLPRLHEVTHVGDDMDFLGDLPLIRLRRAAYRSGTWQAKRLIDVMFSALAIVILSPVLAGCAVAVLIEGGRGIIFRQERIGRDGTRFMLLKFRSLRPVNDDESRTNWNISHDDRLGPVGRVLRATSLDELPQLFNILRGDMSLVGPRPERPYFVEEFGRRYRGYHARHRVPSGLTGWAQIHGLRGDTSIDMRARMDNFYIENWSLWLDIKILLRTFVSVVRAPGS
jgi:exopolysaccharide biosynthesis polyprenyl glycosylphosphotransferase